jgi:CMP-N,N'-diacetyllegionaminic acid synthase
MKNILCTICVRGGSKGVKNKNIRLINGKPLVLYTIEQAKKSKLFTQIAISTDSEKILNYLKKHKNIDLIKRPKKFAKNNSPKIPAIRHCLKKMEKKYNKKYDLICDLDATAPLRKISDIKKALRLIIRNKSDNLFSACISKRNPYFNSVEFKNDRIRPVKNLMKKITCRQNAPKVYDMNASIYIWKRKMLLISNTVFNKKTSLFIMPEERSFDIDTPFDFKIVEFLL